jgi:hypothetical protein
VVGVGLTKILPMETIAESTLNRASGTTSRKRCLTLRLVLTDDEHYCGHYRTSKTSLKTVQLIKYAYLVPNVSIRRRFIFFFAPGCFCFVSVMLYSENRSL